MRLMAFVGVLLVGVVGCSSENEAGTPDDPVSLPPADPSDTDASSCPFTGGTTPTSGGVDSGPTTVTDVKPSKDGCIDDIQFDFASVTPKWSASYTTGAIQDASGAPVAVPSGTNLVLSFENTTAGQAGSAGAPVTVPTTNLDYVKQITAVSGAGGSLQYVVSLDEQHDYLVSSAEEPAYVTLAFG
jgi:hypothetical protein